MLVRVRGVVQGVGFRPFVHALAGRLRLAGYVTNDAEGVVIEFEGDRASVEQAVAEVRDAPPPLALVEAVEVSRVCPRGMTDFQIRVSDRGPQRRTLVSPDVATCDDCLAELADPADRRYRYPFINCTNCGPRYTIVRDVPYDRPATTMAHFAMCAACSAEYHDPNDRRFHAQPIACPLCGPQLSIDPTQPGSEEVVTQAARLLEDGAILAIKGLGGYHLAVDATDSGAVARLRARKHREERPFALMVTDLAAVRALCHVDTAEETLLESPRRPIVLLQRRGAAGIAEPVAPGAKDLGIMLPYTPLHTLLAEAFPRPFVLTSGNRSDEPIAYHDDEARDRLGPLADAFVTHDRPIHTRVDDAVTRSWRGQELLVRRARGYAPQPLPLRRPFDRHVLACGSELKHTFCLGRDQYAFVSSHIGDLENYETLRSFTEGVVHLQRLFDVAPEIVAHDLHPEYLSTKHAMEMEDVDLVGVQHHHAHVASCLADAGHEGPVIGVAFDGLGLGDDGTIWGGELLVADLAGYARAGHLVSVPMPGGQAAIREPWRMASVWLDAAFDGAPPAGLAVAQRHAQRWNTIRQMARTGTNAPQTSSAGRLFDAVAALVGVRDTITYEGQAAIELERWADPAERGRYPMEVLDGEPVRLDATPLIRAVVDDLAAGVAPARISARFHEGLAGGIVAACEVVRQRHGIGTAALSGGVFQNIRLLDRTVDGLEAAGFGVLRHRRVPANDGGISLGHAAVAAARDRQGMIGSAQA